MDRLLIIADDFTGALDTGIQFTKMGIRARIVTDYRYDFGQFRPEDGLLSVSTDTRPRSPKEAYDRVFQLAVNARRAGFRYVYKKTDSGLRGNIGMELKAVMDAYEQQAIAFVPAFPRLNRITRGGLQYIDGIPVKESVFGKDPFEPVRDSDIGKIIGSQTELRIVKVSRGDWQQIDWESSKEQTVFLLDAETDEDLAAIAATLKQQNRMVVMAGCAGFAANYDRMLQFEKGHPHYMQESEGLLALCGSVNQITVDQVKCAEDSGFVRAHLSNERKLGIGQRTPEEDREFYDQLYRQVSGTDKYVLDTLDVPGEETAEAFAKRNGMGLSDIRFQIADSLGRIAMEMVNRGLNYTISMTGGDTLMGFMNHIGKTELVPICEIGKGAVLSAMRWNGKRIQVISKSGGFGEENIFVQMYDTVINYKKGDQDE
ncbi:MAG: four-carbon acid sugar kinase family protein [Lachnospiraceae bacterium]|nr:four-carbon acid sugar kinase family protein [Lachnospiraceae bacterium]